MNVKDLDFNLNFRQYDQQWQGLNATATDNLNTHQELQLALTKRFFNNRLSINVGGNVDFGDNKSATNQQSTNTNAYVTGDFQMSCADEQDGAWRAKTYNRNDYDNFNHETGSTGSGI
jgi:hypothetical protein